MLANFNTRQSLRHIFSVLLLSLPVPLIDLLEVYTKLLSDFSSLKGGPVWICKVLTLKQGLGNTLWSNLLKVALLSRHLWLRIALSLALPSGTSACLTVLRSLLTRTGVSWPDLFDPCRPLTGGREEPRHLRRVVESRTGRVMTAVVILILSPMVDLKQAVSLCPDRVDRFLIRAIIAFQTCD